ncbi:hypothetical protein BDR07DRAFT_1433009 [Suillus spraguei]|nr:hypothetical protein BDR07DRAFT_1433009 [Suillus spraguei]
MSYHKRPADCVYTAPHAQDRHQLQHSAQSLIPTPICHQMQSGAHPSSRLSGTNDISSVRFEPVDGMDTREPLVVILINGSIAVLVEALITNGIGTDRAGS